MLKVEGLVKYFNKKAAPAVNDISFVVENGEVFGIIGKNGAGKSTTIKCITGMIPFDQGKITINNNDIVKDAYKAKSLIGYVPDNHSVYENLTGREYINFIADIYKVKPEDREKSINKYSKLLEIDKFLDIQIKAYSHGMKQKVCILGALVHEPKLWILDEPFLGLDYQSREEVKLTIQDYTKNKKHMVIFSSHDIDTVIELCDRVCLIEGGVLKGIFDLSNAYQKKKLKQEL